MNVNEGNLNLEIDEGIFYNPKMEIHRDLLVTFAKVVKPSSYCDGHSASGVKAIRVCKEANVKNVTAIDLSIKACENIRKNALKNDCDLTILPGDLRKYLLDYNYDLIELDPFGSPAPYIPFVAQSFTWRKSGYLTVTATDTAVLGGAEPNACLRTYRGLPMHRDIVHDIGLRILLKFIQEEFAQYNLAIKPLLSLSHRHYMKLFLKVFRSATETTRNLKSINHFGICKRCGYRTYLKVGEEGVCPHCNASLDIRGPLWTKPIHDPEIVEGMLHNLDKSYPNYDEEVKLLNLVLAEAKTPGYVYDIHKLYRASKIPKTDDLIEYLWSQGYSASRTHYSPHIIKTDAPFELLKIYEN